MATYLVDYENVKTGGLNGISLLTEADRVIIFYSENANRLTFDLHRRLTAAKATVEYREVVVGGHNALDFQLVTYLGYLIAGAPDGQYLIISNDRGFEYVVNFWRKEKKQVGLLSYLKDPAVALTRAMRVIETPAEEPSEAEASPAEEPTEEVTFIAPSEEEAAPAAEEISKEEVQTPPAVQVTRPKLVEVIRPKKKAEQKQPKTVSAVKEVIKRVAVNAKAASEMVEVIKPKKPVVAEPVKEEVPAVIAEPVKEEISEPIVDASVEAIIETIAEAVVEPIPETSETAETVEEARPKPKNKRKTTSKPKAPKAEQPKKDVPKEEAKPDLKTVLGDTPLEDGDLDFLRSAVEKYKTKLGLNNALVKKYGNQKAGELYQKLKGLITEKKK